jgi:hypothetical protein
MAQDDGEAKDERQYTWRFIQAIFWIDVFGFSLSAIFGYSQSEYSGLVLALLGSALGYALGGLFGFLFGFPRYTEPTAVSSAEDLRKLDKGAANDKSLRPSTNLERIVDWLMTMIVGATLVNLQQIMEWSGSQFQALADAISPAQASVPQGALLVLPFAIAGFLHLYLWARRYLPKEWSDNESLRRIEKQVSDFKTQLFQIRGAVLQTMAIRMKDAGVDETTIEDVKARLASAQSWTDDPYKGFAPEKADGFVLEATVRPNEDKLVEDRFIASFVVKRADGAPFTGTVFFLLHNTYPVPYLIRDVQGVGEARAEVPCEEGSFVGAVVATPGAGEKRQTIKLAVDVAKVKDAPKGFS